MKTAIIGAGAAGCFCATILKRFLPEAQIDMYESGSKPLQKVAITGGGRCNLTNSFTDVKSINQVYPRGFNLMKRLFKRFDHQATMRWFEDEGVKLMIQEDHCVFPKSQDAMEIVSILLRGLQGVKIFTSQRVKEILPCNSSSYRISTDSHSEVYDYVVVTTGGSPRASGLDFLSDLALEIVPPVPSLFSFTIAEKDDTTSISKLMGIVVKDAEIRLTGTKFKSVGPLLITHWGMSGPAILRLSSYAARWLAERNYEASLSVNWLGGMIEENVRKMLQQQMDDNPKKQIGSIHPLTQRLWHYLLLKNCIDPERRCADVSSKLLNRLVASVCNDIYHISGKNRYKDEFVTCGGISISNIDPNTLECKKHRGLYFAGEVLDVDAVTGGFNLQAAWTMGYIVAQSIIQRHVTLLNPK
ncbi:MAG: NAD(P)/FAD-dependent oxidoreductase [Bacteroidales bacterium]|nr:NAD(P)/FAD-dependent oxidoreductase [Bacteroidales bacterium]